MPNAQYPLRVALVELGPSRPELHEPLGVEVLAGVVREKFKPEVVSLDVLSLSFQALVMDALDFRGYCMVGLSAKLGTLSRLLTVVHNIRSARQVEDRPLIVIGDLMSTYAYQQLLREIPEAIFVIGEGEDALCGIIRSLIGAIGTPQLVRANLKSFDVPNLAFIDDSNQLIHTSRNLADLITLPPPDRVFLSSALKLRSQVQLEGSRGCPWGHCSFCSIPIVQGTRWRPFPLNSIIDQLIELSSAGARSPYFTDADFLGNDLKRSIEFAYKVIEAKKQGYIDAKLNLYLNLPVSGIVGGEYATEGECAKMLKRLKTAGLREVFVGIESGAVDQMQRYKKAATTTHNLMAISTLRRLGIDFDVGFIMFDPTMSFLDLLSNLDFVYRAGIDAHPSRLTKALRIQPQTSYADEMSRSGGIGTYLNVNNLTHPYGFDDPRVARVYQLYRRWELQHLDIATLVQGAAKGEVGNEEERSATRAYLGRMRQIDTAYLKACVDSVQQDLSCLPGLRSAEIGLRYRLESMIGAVPQAVKDCANRLGLDPSSSLASQSRYQSLYRALNAYEDPVNNEYLKERNNV